MERVRYAEDHWSRVEATAENLDRYLAANQSVYNRTKTRLFGGLLGPDLTGARVLDYGGGAGFMAVLCAERGAEVTLVDAERAALDTAALLAERRGVGARVETLWAERFPPELCGRRFDVVLVKDVIEHIPDDVDLLRSVAACQAPGGRLLLSTQNSWSLNYLIEGTYRRWWCGERGWMGWDPTHVRFYSPLSLARLLGKAGYRARRWAGVYVMPYDIASWFLLLRRTVTFEGLRHVDLTVGRFFPFNRLGWNVVVAAERRGHRV